jgi:hypothetical protein
MQGSGASASQDLSSLRDCFATGEHSGEIHLENFGRVARRNRERAFPYPHFTTTASPHACLGMSIGALRQARRSRYRPSE